MLSNWLNTICRNQIAKWEQLSAPAKKSQPVWHLARPIQAHLSLTVRVILEKQSQLKSKAKKFQILLTLKTKMPWLYMRQWSLSRNICQQETTDYNLARSLKKTTSLSQQPIIAPAIVGVPATCKTTKSLSQAPVKATRWSKSTLTSSTKRKLVLKWTISCKEYQSEHHQPLVITSSTTIMTLPCSMTCLMIQSLLLKTHLLQTMHSLLK